MKMFFSFFVPNSKIKFIELIRVKHEIEIYKTIESKINNYLQAPNSVFKNSSHDSGDILLLLHFSYRSEISKSFPG